MNPRLVDDQGFDMLPGIFLHDVVLRFKVFGVLGLGLGSGGSCFGAWDSELNLRIRPRLGGPCVLMYGPCELVANLLLLHPSCTAPNSSDGFGCPTAVSVCYVHKLATEGVGLYG